MANLNTSILAALPVRLPDKQEQDEIADALDDADVLIVSLERLIAKKQAMKQGMMQELLTGRTRLPGFVEEVCWVPFREVAQPTVTEVNPQVVWPWFLLIEMDNVEPITGRLVTTSEAKDATSLKATFEPGDVLFGKLRSYLRKYWLANQPGICSTEFWVLRPETLTQPAFLRYLVASDAIIAAASGGYGTHMPRADWSVVGEVPIWRPGLDEQRAIAEVLSDADAEVTSLDARLAKARDIKQGMMQELLTGRTRLVSEGSAP